jgi:hypothetical protein
MVGFEANTRHAEGGTRHTLFAGVHSCPFCAGNIHALFVACCVLSLMFVGVAVRVAVQANAVQQFLMLLGRSTIRASQFLASLMNLVSEMPSSRALCAIGFPQVRVNCTASRLHSYVEVFWTFCMIRVLPRQNIS